MKLGKIILTSLAIALLTACESEKVKKEYLQAPADTNQAPSTEQPDVEGDVQTVVVDSATDFQPIKINNACADQNPEAAQVIDEIGLMANLYVRFGEDCQSLYVSPMAEVNYRIRNGATLLEAANSGNECGRFDEASTVGFSINVTYQMKINQELIESLSSQLPDMKISQIPAYGLVRLQETDFDSPISRDHQTVLREDDLFTNSSFIFDSHLSDQYGQKVQVLGNGLVESYHIGRITQRRLCQIQQFAMDDDELSFEQGLLNTIENVSGLYGLTFTYTEVNAADDQKTTMTLQMPIDSDIVFEQD